MKKIVALFAAVLLSASAITCSAADTGSTEKSAPAERTETLAAVGSVSKTYVTVSALQLAERGLIDIDHPVVEYLPEFKMADERYKDITVRMLMDHTSGLMGFTIGNAMVYDDVHTEDHDLFLERLSTQRLKADPGAMASYCNDGFTLLELVVEKVSGMSFTDYVEENICKPLGLEQTGTPLKNFRADNTGRELLNGNVEYAMDYAMAFGSGGIYSTPTELCRYGSTFFTGDETLISDKTKAEMNKNYARNKYEDGFGLSWDNAGVPVYDDAGVKVVVKGGHTVDQSASLMIAPDEKISIAALSSGGDSMCPSYLAEAILDTILEDRGIEVQHPEKPEEMTTVDSVPEKYIVKAGIYAYNEGIIFVTFPEGKYMEMTDITADNPIPERYMYTTEDSFLRMEGEIGSGNERESEDRQILTFTELDGKEYICSDTNSDVDGFFRTESFGYLLKKVGENNADEDSMDAWQQRQGKKYYLFDGRFSNAGYLVYPSIQIYTAEGYVYGKSPNRSNFFTAAVKDKGNALAFIEMPGSGGGNLKDVRIDTADGHEVLDLTNTELRFIEEGSIEDFSSDIREIVLEKGKAKWYNISDMGGKSIILDISEKASVYVYDKYDNMVYSSYMKDYGSEVALPKEGKIVFVGEDGAKVDIG